MKGQTCFGFSAACLQTIRRFRDFPEHLNSRWRSHPLGHQVIIQDENTRFAVAMQLRIARTR